MASDYKVIKISRRRKDETNASYIVQNGEKIDQIKVPQDEVRYEKGDVVDTKYIDSFNKVKLYKDYQKINCNEEIVYKSNLKEIANFIQKSYKEPAFLKKQLLWEKVLRESQTPNHSKCAGKKSNDKKKKQFVVVCIIIIPKVRINQFVKIVHLDQNGIKFQII